EACGATECRGDSAPLLVPRAGHAATRGTHSGLVDLAPLASRYCHILALQTARESLTTTVVLACGTLLLERLQHVRVPSGIAICGDAYKSRRVDLATQQVKAQKIIHDLTDYLQGHKKPRLWLNNHCRICRYQQQCQAEATQLDDLSLLHRM